MIDMIVMDIFDKWFVLYMMILTSIIGTIVAYKLILLLL